MSHALRRFGWSQVGLSSLVLTASAAPSEKPAGPVVTPSPEITHFTAPLDKDGYVDFHAALNNELSRGVSAAENAAIPLLQAMGPCEGSGEVIAMVLKALGAAPGPLDFKSQRDFMTLQGIGTEAETAFFAQYEQAQNVPWMKADHPQIAAMVAANEQPLAAMALAVQKPKYYRPMLVRNPNETLVSVLLPDIQESRDVARQLKCRAMWHLGEGRTVEAQQDLLTIHRLGGTIGRGATLIENLVGIAINSIASAGDNVWAAHPDITAEQIAAYRQQVAALPPVCDMVRSIDLTERGMCMDVTQAIARGRFSATDGSLGELLGPAIGNEDAGAWLDVGKLTNALVVMSVDWNVTMQTLNRQFDDVIKSARQVDRAQRMALLNGFEEQLKVTKSETTSFKGIVSNVIGGSNSRGKTFGNVLGTLLMPAVRQALAAQDQSIARRDLTVVMLALAEYQHREGKFPDSLAALAPQYLAVVPDDLMSGKPFRYSSEGSSYRLYSVGRNERDDNGQMGMPQGADDILMAYPPPAR
ncbi:MAG TPA: hypothetical protein VM165_19500 [Planctomycetaceae bacterium]|nr:hypothetical protein [Planctomycetaceae bacterium]